MCKIEDSGNISYVFYPHVGYERHIFDSSFSIYYNNRILWHWDYSWNVSQEYIPNTNILNTVYENDDFLINMVDYVPISENIIVRNLKVMNKGNNKKSFKLFFYENIRIGEYPKKTTVRFIGKDNLMLKYNDNYVFVIGSSKNIDSHQCGIKTSLNSAYKGLENGILTDNNSVSGYITDSALSWDLNLNPGEETTLSIHIAMAKCGNYTSDTTNDIKSNIIEVINNTMDVCKLSFSNKNDFFNLTVQYWNNISHLCCNNYDTYSKYNKCNKYIDEYNNNLLINNEYYKQLCRRALLSLILLADKEGGIIASPSLHPDYRYVWNRDGSYISVAFDLCGKYQLSERFFDWCSKTQNDDGSWLQNYYITKKPRLTAMQNDQVGTTLWAMLVHYRLTKSVDFLKKYYKTIVKAMDYLYNITINMSPSFDLWEEKVGLFSYTVGATYGGLKAGYTLINQLKLNENYDVDNDLTRWMEGIRFWEDRIDLFIKDDHFVKSINPLDTTPDTSILGLTFPFGLISPSNRTMLRTAERIEKSYNYKIGGIGRYPDDVYFGGNPWIITTLWLYLYYKRLIDDLKRNGNYNNSDILKYKNKCDYLLNWGLKYMYNGLYPEQVHKDLGLPVSGMPLGWSHAMVIIALIDNLDILIP